MAAMLVVGFIAARKAAGFEDFAVAGRSLPLSVTAATVFATWLGAGPVMGAAGAAYEGGILAVIADPFGGGVALLLAGLLMARMMRRLGIVSVIDIIRQKFGMLASVLGSLSLLATYMIWAGAQLVAFGFILSSLTGIAAEWGMIAGTVVVLLYTVTGGMWAVALTDMMQGVLITVGVVVLGAVVLEVAGGWSVAVANAPDGAFHLWPHTRDISVWTAYLRDWSILAVGNLAAQDLMQRAFSAKTERVAVNAFWIAGTAYLFLGLIPVLNGIFGVALMPDIADPEYLILELAQTYMGPVLLTVFLGALLAAIMSSADSALLASSSVVSSNLLTFLIKQPSDRQKFVAARVTIAVIGLAALAVGLAVQDVFDLVIDALSSILVILAAPMIAAFYLPFVNRTGVCAGMITGGSLWLVLPQVSEAASTDFLGFFANSAVMLILSWVTRSSDPPRPLLNADGSKERLEKRLGLPG